MARLVVNPGSPTAWEFQLKPGANFIGRGFANDFKLTDGSVSGSHCEIVVESSRVVIKDLGSTNGTYVNRAPVKEAVLQSGQTIHLGAVAMAFYADAPTAATGAAQTAPPPVPIMAPRPVAVAASPAAAPRVASPATVVLAAPPASVARVAPPTAVPVAPPPMAAPPIVAPPAMGVGSAPCKHHPKTPGRYFCSHCQLFYCEICVTSRAVGGVMHKYCRHCGAECVPVQVVLQRAAGPKGFFARLPAAFIYPFKGSGLLVLIVSTLMLGAMDAIGFTIFTALPYVIVLGYLFSYMQNIIHATANEEEQMPELPGFDDVLGGAFRLVVTGLACFSLPVVFFALKVFEIYDAPASAIIATMVLGCLYFPMAFLAVALKDSTLACNPLVVIPAILKVPLGYLCTAVIVIGVFGLRLLGDFTMKLVQSEGYHTRDMSVLFLSFGVRAGWTFAKVYLLTVSMRVLGLLYVANKEKFGWFDH